MRRGTHICDIKKGERMYKLAFVIVTYKRRYLLERQLGYALAEWEKRGIGVYVLDGSDDGDTRQLTEAINSPDVHYLQYPDTPIGYRVIEGCRAADAEYVCICGDSVLPVFENYDKLFGAMEAGYDLIDLSYRDPKNYGERIYSDIVQMFRECTWDMTQMGNVFFKKGSCSLFSYEEYRARFNTDYFVQNAVYFECCNSADFGGYFAAIPIIKPYDGEKPHSWQDKIFEVANYGWYDYVVNSDAKYDDVKKDVLLSHGVLSGLRFDTKRAFIRLRILGALTPEVVDKYEFYIKATVPVDIGTIRKISKMPRKFLFLIYKATKNIKKKLKRAS